MRAHDCIYHCMCREGFIMQEFQIFSCVFLYVHVWFLLIIWEYDTKGARMKMAFTDVKGCIT